MKKKSGVILIILLLLIIVAIAGSMNHFTGKATQNATNRAKETLMDNANEQAVTLKVALNEKFMALEALSTGIHGTDATSAAAFFNEVQRVVNGSDMYAIYIVGPTGAGYASFGEKVDVSDRFYFGKTIGGSRAMEMVTGRVSGMDVVMLSVPIHGEDGSVIGVLAASYAEKSVRQLVASSAFDGEAYSYIIDANGDVVVGTDSSEYLSAADNILATMAMPGFASETTIEDIRTAIEEKADTVLSFTIDGKERLAVAAPLATESIAGSTWFVVNVVPMEKITEQAAAEKRSGLEQSIIILLLGVLTVFIFVFNERRNRKRLEKESMALRTENQRFNVVYNTATISVWDYDFATKEVHQDQRCMKIHGFGRVIKDVPESLVKSGFVHPDSARAYLDMYRKLFSGAKTAEGVFRVQTADRLGWWYESVRYTTLYDENGKPYAAIGMSEDVTERREQEMAYNKWQKEISAISNDNSTIFGWNLTKDMLDGSEKTSFKAMKIMDPDAGLNILAKVYADEYVYPDDAAELLRFMNRERLIGMYYDDVFSDEMDYRESTGSDDYSWMHLSVQLVQYPDSEEIKAYVVSRDIDREKRDELELIARSERDALTDALNRDAFETRVGRFLEESEAGSCHAFLMMDIDEFKSVNDNFGHDAGDRMLEELIRAIRSVLRFDDIIGRIGGDEFMVCMKDVTYDAVIEKKAQQLNELLRRKLSDEVMVSLSIGISVFPRDGVSFDALYKAADTALYFTKEHGKDGYNFFTPGMLSEAKNEKTTELVGSGIVSDSLPKQRMLIVDSDDEDREKLTRIFGKEYAVITTKSGTSALSQIKRYGSSISIVLLELELPQMSGYDVIAQMKSDSLLAQLPVIMITSNSDRQTYINLISAGAADVLTRPLDEELTMLSVHGVLARVENERSRAQKNYLRLQGAEEERYRRVLSATGTVVILHDWQSNIFSYDSSISEFIGAEFDARPLDRIFIEDGVCTEQMLSRLMDLENQMVNDPECETIEKLAKLTVPGGSKHFFRVQIIKMSGEYELTEKILITLNDVNDSATAEEELKRRAERDTLTGLYNRETFFVKVGELVYTERPSNYIMAAFDINNFKAVNDQYGQAVGDLVLQRMSALGQEAFEKVGGVCCRISADNFAGVYPSTSSAVDFITEQRSFIMEGQELAIQVSFSVGRYVIEDLSLPVSAMYDRANMAKKTIKGRYDVHTAYYNASMREDFLREQMIIGSMEHALREEQFVVYFQPQYNHSSGAMIGAEALVRWRHPEEGLISPASFIPIFERNGFIYKLDTYVWETTCRLLRKWLDAGIEVLPVSVNVSRFDIYQPDFFHMITSLLTKYDLSTDLLRLEITETAFSTSPKQIIKIVKKLVDYGFVVEIDDFGSGYSSLNTLKDVPAQMLKLDMRFMEDSETTRRGGSIINSVVRMAKWLYMPVIAEGVETIDQADFLKSIGCDYVQGYLYAKPMPDEDYEKLLADSSKETRMETLRTISTLDPNTFWDPKSMETLIFNSYVGGASVIEYYNGTLEYLRVNEKYMKELNVPGITERQALMADPLGFCSEEDKRKVIDAMELADSTDSEQEFEIYDVYPQTGTSAWLRGRVTPIGRSAGRVLMYLAIENITNSKLAEQRIRDTSVQMETIMDTIDSGVCAYAIEDYYNGHVLFANTQYYSMFGFTESQFTGEVKSIFDVIHPDEKKRVIRHVLEAIEREGELISYDYRGIRRDGTQVIVHGDSKIISITGEDCPVLLVVTSDVTAKAEEKQAAELRQYTDALMGLYDEIYEFNFQENVIKRIDSALDTGFAVAEKLLPRIYRLIETFVHPDDAARVIDYVQRYEEGELAGTSSEFEFRLYSEREPIWMRCRTMALTDTRNLVMLHDETMQKNETLAAERYHMILDLMTEEEAPYGIVLIDTATEEYELISVTPQARAIPSKGKYNDLVDFLMSLVPSEEGRRHYRQVISLGTIEKALIAGNGEYIFEYEFDNAVASGRREAVVRYSDDWKNELIMAVRLKSEKKKAGAADD